MQDNDSISGRNNISGLAVQAVGVTAGRDARMRLRRGTVTDLAGANETAGLLREFKRLRSEEHLSLRQAAAALGRSPSYFAGATSVLARYNRGGVAELLPVRGGEAAAGVISDVTKSIEELGWFVSAAEFFYLLTNRTRYSGSVPESIRRVISLPALPVGWTRTLTGRFLKRLGLDDVPSCPPELREAILARQSAGQALVPERIARRIASPRAVVRQRRNPTDAGLDYLNASGSMFFITDRRTGERRPPLVGEVIEADDATINFPVCVPWTLGGDPCSEKYGVKVGRFQWLVSVDARSRNVTAWTYVMRPRSSYRAEDALALMRAHCVEHGVPGQWRFEQGVWKSNLVKHAVAGMGSALQTVWSPHQKPYIEGMFNALWTKLSVQFPDSEVGRYRGETEEANDLLVACQRGTRDPKKHFPMLSDALAAFRESVAEKNSTPVESAIGRWIPVESMESGVGRYPVRRLDPETDWMFSPYVREWKVRGMIVGGRVPLFEDLSVPFDFAADWMTRFDGVRVRCHFNPSDARCHATVVLCEDHGEAKAGTVLGTAAQINEVAGYARLVLGWGDDPTNAGRLARQRAASALRREVRAVIPRGGKGYTHSEERDGVVLTTRVENDSSGATLPPERDGAGSVGRDDAAASVPRGFSRVDRSRELEIELAERAERNAQLRKHEALDYL